MLPYASLSSLRARSIFSENIAFPALSLAFVVSGREREAEARRALSRLRSLSLARSPPELCPLVGSRGTTTGRVPEIIVRIDPRATRTGWIYSRARGERRKERRRGTEQAGERASLLNRFVFETGAINGHVVGAVATCVFPNLNGNGICEWHEKTKILNNEVSIGF